MQIWTLGLATQLQRHCGNRAIAYYYGCGEQHILHCPVKRPGAQDAPVMPRPHTIVVFAHQMAGTASHLQINTGSDTGLRTAPGPGGQAYPRGGRAGGGAGSRQAGSGTETGAPAPAPAPAPGRRISAGRGPPAPRTAPGYRSSLTGRRKRCRSFTILRFCGTV